MLPNEYARAALLRGLAFEQSLGANPYKFGLIGSTDNHTGLDLADDVAMTVQDMAYTSPIWYTP